jgi:hypothetical protein
MCAWAVGSGAACPSRTPMSNATIARSGTSGSTNTLSTPSRRHRNSPRNGYGPITTSDPIWVSAASHPHRNSKWLRKFYRRVPLQMGGLTMKPNGTPERGDAQPGEELQGPPPSHSGHLPAPAGSFFHPEDAGQQPTPLCRLYVEAPLPKAAIPRGTRSEHVAFMVSRRWRR